MPATRCTSCAVEFATVDEMTAHYGTEFHATNVRRRVGGQGPLSLAEFNRQAGAAEDAPTSFACKLCNKTFRSVQTLQTHVRSTAHLMKKEQRILARDSEAATMLTATSLGSAALGLHRRFKAHGKSKAHADAQDDGAAPAPKVPLADREADVTETRCLFCGLQSTSMRVNLRHMLDAHGFVVPMVERCANVQGLLQYLARKVNGLICLVCGGGTKSYASLEALRAHMQNAGHEYLVMGPEYDAFYTGGLDDGAPMDHPTDGHGAILAPSGVKVARRHESGFAVAGQRNETVDQTEQRRAIAWAGHQQQTALLKDRADETRKETTAAAKMRHRENQHMQRLHMYVGMKTGKQHKKGYEGDGEN